MKNVHPFKINVTDEILDDLKKRLLNTRWVHPLKKDAGWITAQTLTI